MRARLGGVIVGLVVLPCCSLFVSTSGLEGDEGTVTPDASANVDGSPAPPPTSGTDAPADTGRAPDATEADAGRLVVCDDTAIFCTDVENADGIGVFSSTQVAPGTTLAVETGESRSPTRAIHVTTARTNVSRETTMTRSLPNVYDDVRLRFAMRMDAPTFQAGDRGTHVFSFVVALAATTIVVTLEVMPDRSVIAFTSHANDAYRTLSKPITYGTWHAFDLEVRLTGNRVRILMDGTETLDREDVAYPAPSTPSAVSYTLGALALNVPHPGVSIRFDDIRADER